MATPIESAMNAAMKPVDSPQASTDGAPHATHSGEFEIVPGLKLQCYRLSTGQAVITQESMDDLVAWLESGATPAPSTQEGK